MGGFKNYTGGSGKYLSFKEGKIIARDAEGNKEEHGIVEGYIKDIFVSDEAYEGKEYKQIQLFLDMGSDFGTKQLNFALESGYGNAFCCMAMNIDPSKEVEISGSYEKKQGKAKTGMFIRQGNKPIKWVYTKDSDAGKKVPPAKEVKIGNKIIWDFSERNAYFENMLTDLKKGFISKVRKAWPDGAPTYKGNDPLAGRDGWVPATEDLPFD